MNLLLIGDLHGRKPRVHFKNFDAIIQVGDVASDKELAPWTKKWFKYIKENPEESISLDKFLVSKLGRKRLKKMEKRSLNVGRKILEYLNSFNKPVFIVPGNWDESYGESKIKNPDKDTYSYLKAFYDWWLGDKINPKLIKGLKNIKDCQYKLRKFKGINFIGYGLVSAPEDLSIRKKGFKINGKINKKQWKILEKSYSKIIVKLDGVFKEADKKLPIIFISHNIPYKTKLDIITDKKSYAYKKHLGSFIARRFCIKYKPILCIGGHIHDHKGKDKIGKTIVINPGFGSNAQVLVEVDNEKGKIKNIKFLK